MDEEDALDSESESINESDGRWKSNDSSSKRLKTEELDYMALDDDEVDQLLAPEDEDYRDMSAPEVSLDHPEDDSVLDQDGSNVSDTSISKQNIQTQNLDDVISSNDGHSRCDGQSVGDSSEGEAKRDSVDEDIPDHLFITESGDEDEDDESSSHSSRFKSERKMLSVNRGYRHAETVPPTLNDVTLQHREDNSHPTTYQNNSDSLPGKHPRVPSRNSNMRSYPHHRPPRGHRSYPPNRRPYPRRHSGSPPPPPPPPLPYRLSPPPFRRSPPRFRRSPLPFRRSPPPYGRPRSPPYGGRSPPHHGPWPPYQQYYPQPPRPPPYLPGHPRSLFRDRPLAPLMPERRRPPPSSHRHPPFVDREPVPPLMPPSRPYPGYDRMYEGYSDDRERAPPPLMPPSRPQHHYDRAYKGYADDKFDHDYDNYDYSNEDQTEQFERFPHHPPPENDFVPIKVEPREQLELTESLMPQRPVPLVVNSQPDLDNLPSRPPTIAQPPPLISHELPRKHSTLQSNSQAAVAASNVPAKEEFNFNLAVAKQRVEAMQSTGLMGIKGNPFLKLQHHPAEPKTVVVKPVVRQQEPPPPPPPRPAPHESSQLVMKPASLPRLPENQVQARPQPLMASIPVERPKLLNRQISVDTLQKRTALPVRRTERHSSAGSIQEASRLMDIKPLPVQSITRTVVSESPNELPTQFVPRTVTEPSNNTAVQTGSQPVHKVVVNKTVTQKRNPGTTMAQRSKATLVVSDLPAGMSSQQLKELFSEVGAIKNLRILPGQNKAVVTFAHPRDALGCRRKFHRGVVDGTHINVSFV